MDRDLLLKDLCARIPYGVICNYREGLEQEAKAKLIGWSDNLCVFDIKIGEGNGVAEIYSVMPYLRKISSITKEEKKALCELGTLVFQSDGILLDVLCTGFKKRQLVFDWLNAHHFDYLGLIDKGMALNAPDGMYG